MVEVEEREGGDITYADMIVPEELPSDIQLFYKDAKILITGGTGLLGLLLTEKLLRRCSELSKIYLLIRSKKEKGIARRLEEIFDNSVFNRLKMEQIDYEEKIMLIAGDYTLPNLGLSYEDHELLRNDINVIFHIGATTKLNETLRKAAAVNVLSTRHLINLARGMKHLKAFIYVSTIYSQYIYNDIDETFSKVPISAAKILSIIDNLDAEKLELLTPRFLEDWPNTYTFTKAMAECIIQTEGRKLPVAIVRPSIVSSTTKEPAAGWVNNVYGVSGVTLATAVGLLHTLMIDVNTNAEWVPADYCVNLLISAAWHVGITRSENLNDELLNSENIFEDMKVQDNIPIFNFVSSTQSPITWKYILKKSRYYASKVPSKFYIWHSFLFTTKSQRMNTFYTWMFHLIPAAILDKLLLFSGKQPRLQSIYQSIAESNKLIQYFVLEKWTFQNSNTRTLWKKLNSTDKKLFEFDMTDFNWDSYLNTFVRGARVYLLNDPLDTVEETGYKLLKLKFLHYSLVTVLFLSFIWVLSVILF